jgi:DNA-binding Xre family transcriptional regulator
MSNKAATPSAIGMNLDRIMTARKMRPVDLEAASGISRVTIWQLRTGRAQSASMATLEKLAAALGVPVSMFVGVTTAADGENVVRMFLESGEAGRMMPPPTQLELAYLRKHGALFNGPTITPRGVAFLLLRLRESPEWAAAISET